MALLIIFRCLTEKSTHLVEFIAIINLIALLIVIYSILVQIKEGLVKRIEAFQIPNAIALREKNSVSKRLDFIVYIPFGLFSILYVIFFPSALLNDIITIVALCLSVSDEYIVEAVTNNHKLWGTLIMEQVINLIKSFFDTGKWQYHYREKDKVFLSGVNMNNVLGTLKIQILIDKDYYTVYVYLPAKAEKSCFDKVSEYLHRANFGLQNGNFEIDYEDGEIRYKSFVDFENTKLSKDIVAKSIIMPIFMFDRYGRGLIKLMLNEGDPKELIQEAEKDYIQKEDSEKKEDN